MMPRRDDGPMTEQSTWAQIVADDPDHSAAYVERFRTMAAQGADLGGEARLVDALLPRRARVLDAGCGPGRVGAFLAAAGHEVVGVDADPVLIEAAEADHPGPHWIVGDLADAQAAGLLPDLLLSTWDLRPATPDADFLVAILRPGHRP
jgi:SAM-dependent methyltransferase